MKVKNRRHAKILELIKDNNIETQDELTLFLNASGFKTTQATVSRDIKELHLVKILTKDNVYRYEQREKAGTAVPHITAKSQGIMRDSIISLRTAQNLIVVKCYSGMAQAACAAVDALDNEMIIGTIAGDDTILLVASDNASAETVKNDITSIITK